MKKDAFFNGTRPGEQVALGGNSAELPILYFRDDLFAIFVPCSLARVREILPTDRLKPVSLGGGRAVVGFGAFNYIDTSIGPYGEVGVIIPVIYDRTSPPLIPLLLETWYPGLGFLVMHLPVTTLLARDGGRMIWGYTKFTSRMHFTNTPERITCELSEGGKDILRMTMRKRGILRRDNRPLITYSVLNRELLRTTVLTQAIYLLCFRPGNAEVVLGEHPVADTIRALEPGKRPIQSRFYVERSSILPRGEVVAQEVEPMEGFRGEDREGALEVTYL